MKAGNVKSLRGEVHPQVRALLSTVFSPTEDDAAPTIEVVRSVNDDELGALIGQGEEVERVWDGAIGCGEDAISVRWYLADGAASSHVIVYVHGGGWVSGNLESYDTLCRSMARRAGALLLSIDYARSPESPFLTAIAQVTRALEHARAYVEEFGFPGRRLSVAADSSGAQILAAALHLLAERHQPMPDSAAFIYPALDATMRHETWSRFGTGFRLTRKMMEWYWTQYLGRHPRDLGNRLYDPQISPLYSHHLAQFPRSMVLTAECDPLRGEGEEFFRRLNEAAVVSEYLPVPAQIHGFLRFRQAFTDPHWGADAVMQRICTFLCAR
ncbi:alpha/beta hydrolase [Paraburkholderia sacchari]|uniref:alpha/beta hydrolase n=1 Tax=Paraburkholderia sacchari TaxID=159450 RepID=UPI001BD111AC|nr:alpha/beta hydrolase [Paraburkholderia sacchari]